MPRGHSAIGTHAEAYWSSVEITAIKVNQPQEPVLRPGSPRALLKALEAFVGDEEALYEHFEELARKRQRQRQKDGLCAGSTRG